MSSTTACQLVVFESGERFPVLFGRDRLPISLPMRYVVLELRRRLQWRSIKKILEPIRWLYNWTAEKGIDLEYRLRYGPALASHEIFAFAIYLRTGRVTSNIIMSIGRNECAPKGDTYNRSLQAVEGFLTWALSQRRGEFAAKEISLTGAPGIILKQQKTGKSPSPNKRGIIRHAFDALMIAARPGGANNPFHRQKTQFKNYLLIRLMFETGLREGEVASLYASDVETRGGQRTVMTKRRPDNPLDSRRYEPNVKTRERVIPVTEGLAGLLIEYLIHYRGNAKHPFLFVSQQGGKPISLSLINKVFEAFRNIHPGLIELAPHDARRTFNDFFFEKASEMKVDAEILSGLQNYANGWAPGSAQSQKYARRAIEAKAMEIAEKMQEGLYGA